MTRSSHRALFKPGGQLDELLAGRWLPATRDAPVRHASDLPFPLTRRVGSLTTDETWRAFGNVAHAACAIARVIRIVHPHGDSGPAGRRQPGLAVQFLDSSARVCCAGTWAWDPVQRWTLHAITELQPGARSGVTSAGRAPRNRSA